MGPVWAIVGGHALLEIITVILLMVGLRQVIQRPAVRGGIGLIGGAFLAYMGIDMMLAPAAVTLEFGARRRDAVAAACACGAFVCAVNPYFVGWWATIGTGQLAHTRALQHLGVHFVLPRTRAVGSCVVCHRRPDHRDGRDVAFADVVHVVDTCLRRRAGRAEPLVHLDRRPLHLAGRGR
jgi:threonine/homoserine/homoserine lactone efflux protein